MTGFGHVGHEHRASAAARPGRPRAALAAARLDGVAEAEQDALDRGAVRPQRRGPRTPAASRPAPCGRGRGCRRGTPRPRSPATPGRPSGAGRRGRARAAGGRAASGCRHQTHSAPSRSRMSSSRSARGRSAIGRHPLLAAAAEHEPLRGRRPRRRGRPPGPPRCPAGRSPGPGRAPRAPRRAARPPTPPRGGLEPPRSQPRSCAAAAARSRSTLASARLEALAAAASCARRGDRAADGEHDQDDEHDDEPGRHRRSKATTCYSGDVARVEVGADLALDPLQRVVDGLACRSSSRSPTCS